MINSLRAPGARELLRVSERKSRPGPITISDPGVFFAERVLPGLATRAMAKGRRRYRPPTARARALAEQALHAKLCR